ncbi:MAG: O-antigen ligase family protein [Calditrichia bacterium]|jgi:hypothetical protein|nr:O-antigen ligase family protein [Calditrichia bacterium]
MNKLQDIHIGKIGIWGFAFFAPLSIAASQIFIGIALLGWLLKMFQERSFVWKRTPLDIPILIYVITQIIAVLLSRDIATGLGAWINTDWFILFYYACINLIDSEEDFSWIPIILAISGSISAIYGIVQHFVGIDFVRDLTLTSRGDFFRAAGFFSLSLTYGGIQLGLFLFLFPFTFLQELKINKSVFRIILLLLFASIIASYARSAWLGLGMITLILPILLRKKIVYYLWGALLLLFILVYFIHPDLLFRYGIFSMFDTSESAPYNNLVRIKLWQSTWAMIQDNWLFGIGYSDYTQIFSSYKIPFDYGGLNDPHNDFLKVMALSGLIGGLAYIVVWFRFLKEQCSKILTGISQISFWQAGVLGSTLAVISFLTAGLAQEYYHDAEVAELWWFIVALGIICTMKLKSATVNK